MTPERIDIIRDILSHAPWNWILLTIIFSEVVHLIVVALAITVAMATERKQWVRDWREKPKELP